MPLGTIAALCGCTVLELLRREGRNDPAREDLLSAVMTWIQNKTVPAEATTNDAA
jgi:hypothetical protein